MLVELPRPAPEHRGPERDQLPLHARCLKPPIWTRRRTDQHGISSGRTPDHALAHEGGGGVGGSERGEFGNNDVEVIARRGSGELMAGGIAADSPPGRGVSGRRVQHAHRGSADWRGRCHSAAVAVGGGARWRSMVTMTFDKGSEDYLLAGWPSVRRRGVSEARYMWVPCTSARAIGVWLGWGCFLGGDVMKSTQPENLQRCDDGKITSLSPPPTKLSRASANPRGRTGGMTERRSRRSRPLPPPGP